MPKKCHKFCSNTCEKGGALVDAQRSATSFVRTHVRRVALLATLEKCYKSWLNTFEKGSALGDA
jgi:hypothetical protein